VTVRDFLGAVEKPSSAWLFRTCSIVALGLGSASVAMAAPPVLTSDAAKLDFLNQHMAPVQKWRPLLMDGPPPTAKGHALRMGLNGTSVGTTLPYWSTVITSPLDGHSYDLSMVGGNPYDAHPSNTNITYVPVAMRIHLGSFVLDPSVPSKCDAQSPMRRFFNSPLFRPTTFVSNGVNVSAIPGGTQIMSAFQRANFWNAVHDTPYGVTLIPSRLSPIVVDWYPSNPQDYIAGVSSNCGGAIPVAVVNINEYDSELQAIAAAYSGPGQLPIILADDVAIYVGNDVNNCCVLGYHNAVPVPGGTQVYATGAYFDSDHVFGPHFADITVWTHEMAELFDDPFVQSIPGVPGGTHNGLTPAWGHTGQVSGCQNNLETGDPLTPDQNGSFGNYPVVGVEGFTYHYQDEAFHDWFYRTPSTSTGGKYSFVGNFISVQGACH